MEVIAIILGLVADVLASTVVVLCVYHWCVREVEGLCSMLSRVGLILACIGLIHAYFFAVEVFIAWYGEPRYEVFVSGQWYQSDHDPWLMYAISLVTVIAALLFWVPSIRSKPMWAFVLSLILLIPPILGAFAPTEMPVPG